MQVKHFSYWCRCLLITLMTLGSANVHAQKRPPRPPAPATNTDLIACPPLTVAIKSISPADHFPPREGDRVVDGAFTKAELAENEIYQLGKGFGGFVYRFKPKKAGMEPHILKIYNVEEELDKDLRAFGMMDTILQGSGIRVITRSKLSPNRMKVENIYGQPLKTLLNRKENFPAAAEFQRRYDLIRGELIEKLKKQNLTELKFRGAEPGSKWFAASYKNADGKKVDVSFKPDNIIVDSKSLEWILIDPF